MSDFSRAIGIDVDAGGAVSGAARQISDNLGRGDIGRLVKGYVGDLAQFAKTPFVAASDLLRGDQKQFGNTLSKGFGSAQNIFWLGTTRSIGEDTDTQNYLRSDNSKKNTLGLSEDFAGLNRGIVTQADSGFISDEDRNSSYRYGVKSAAVIGGMYAFGGAAPASAPTTGPYYGPSADLATYGGEGPGAELATYGGEGPSAELQSYNGAGPSADLATYGGEGPSANLATYGGEGPSADLATKSPGFWESIGLKEVGEVLKDVGIYGALTKRADSAIGGTSGTPGSISNILNPNSPDGQPGYNPIPSLGGGGFFGPSKPGYPMTTTSILIWGGLAIASVMILKRSKVL